MDMAETIRSKLDQSLSPLHLEVKDESALHAGHAGARPGGQTHFRVTVVSAAFEGLSRVDRHRRINSLLAAELADRVHALAIRALAATEWKKE